MIKEIGIIALLTVLPVFELRGGIPYGIFRTDIPILTVVLVAIITNILLAPLLYLFLNYFINLFLRVGFVKTFWDRFIIKAQKKVQPYIEKYGIAGLALFIGIPLPGSGVYTAAVGAYLLGYKFKEFFIASVLGVLIAATAVTLISLFGSGIWLWFIK